MKIDICIPVWKNIECLRTMALGLKNHLAKPEDVTILLHLTDESENEKALNAFINQGFMVKVVSTGNGQVEAPFEFMNRLFAAATSKWVIMTEQDFFPTNNIDMVAAMMDKEGYVVAGPMDFLFHDNPNAKKMPKYGTYTRLSPLPGYFHSALLIINREYVAAKTKTPFTIPEGFKFHGHGVIGAEQYYGLRFCIPDTDNDKIVWFRQVHAGYGYAAAIFMGNDMLGLHLFYSSRYTTGHGLMAPDELAWLESEEKRFLADYTRMESQPK